MKHRWNRAIALTLALILSLPPAALAAPTEDDQAQLLEVTTGDYICKNAAIKQGALYTLIALPSTSSLTQLDAATLLAQGDKALYIGSAIAAQDGEVKFENVRLKTAQAVTYFVTGPGLATPLMEKTGETSLSGTITTGTANHTATLSLVDTATQYHYANTETATKQGDFEFYSIAPASYKLRVTKPGFLPYDHPTSVNVSSGSGMTVGNIDISANIGDVNNNGVRDLTDLAQLLLYYGENNVTVSGLTPDLSGDGAVDQSDVDLLTAHLTTGSGAPENGAISVTDEEVPGSTSGLRKLIFKVTGGSTFSAAAITLQTRKDAVRVMSSTGGLITPADGGAMANCLTTPATVQKGITSWSVNDATASLTFTLTAPTALGVGTNGLTVAEFYYQPMGGTPAGLFEGAFALPKAAALMGRSTVVTTSSLTYPNCEALYLQSISIQPAGPITLTIPTAGRTTVQPLTVSGVDVNNEAHTNVSGVTWTVKDSGNNTPAGVSVAEGILTVTSAAAQGTFTLTATHGSATATLNVTLKQADPVPTALELWKDGGRVSSIGLEGEAGEVFTADLSGYTLKAFDQYGMDIAAPTDLTWALSGAPEGVSLSGRTLTVAASVPGGEHTFTLQISGQATVATLRLSLPIRLKLKTALHALMVSGPQSAYIPADGSISLTYDVTGVDRQGRPVEGKLPNLSLSLQTPASAAGISTNPGGVDGPQVVVDAAAQPGDYILLASHTNEEGQIISTQFTLTLKVLETPSQGSYAALYLDGDATTAPALTVQGGSEFTAHFTAQVLDGENNPIETQPSFTWTLDGAPAGVTLTDGVLTVSPTTAAGAYSFSVTAASVGADPLSATVPVSLTVAPTLKTLTLTAPGGERVAIPTGDPLVFTPTLDARDTNGQTMTPPADLTWSVSYDGKPTQATTGLTLSNGALTVSSTAVPGDIVLTASYQQKDGEDKPVGEEVTASLKLTLVASSNQPYLLQLYREGRPVEPVEAADLKQTGSPMTWTYTAKVIDQATGQEVTTVEGQPVEITWRNDQRSLTLGSDALPGHYEDTFTAFWNGQSASVNLQLELYPDIVSWEIDWGGQLLKIPQKGVSPTYTGTIVAITSAATGSRRIPLSQLETGYEISGLEVALPGVYAQYDQTNHSLSLTLNSTAAAVFEKGEDGKDLYPADKRVLRMVLSYFPGESLAEMAEPLDLRLDTAVPTSVSLLRGVGSGTSFAFTTPATNATDKVEAAAGTLSNCYALQISDQYGQPMKGQVDWFLRPAANSTIPDGIKLGQPSFAGQYTNYASVYRLQVDSTVPEGLYNFSIVAKTGSFEAVLPVALTVKAAATIDSVNISGITVVVVPPKYNTYNSTKLYNQTKTAAYTVSLKNTDGQDMELTGHTITWTLTDKDGKDIPGASVRSNSDGSATLTLDCRVKPTGKLDNRAILTATDSDSKKSQSMRIELARTASYPIVLALNEQYTSSEISLTVNKTSEVRRTFTFQVLDQYGEPLSVTRYPVTFTKTPALPSGTTFNALRHSSGTKYDATLTVGSSTTSGGAYQILAKCAIDDIYGVDTLSAKITVNISTGSGGGNGGGGTIGGGTTVPTPSPSPSPSPTPTPTPLPVRPGSAAPQVTQTGASASATLTPEEEQNITAGTGTVVITPTGGSGLTNVNLTVSTSALATVAGQGRQVEVETPVGNVVLSPEAVKALAQSGGTSATVTLNKTGNTYQVSFKTSQGTATFPAAGVTLQGKDPSYTGGGNVAVKTENGQSTLLPKIVVENGQVTVPVTSSCQITVQQRSKEFADLPASHWAHSSVSFMAARELFQGTSQSTFTPTGTTTRGTVVTVLHRLELSPKTSSGVHFSDVGDTWYTEGVAWASSKGIVQGSGGLFHPDDPVTREQLAVMLFNYAKTQNISTSNRSSLTGFKDGSATSNWARDAMGWAVNAGLIGGKGGGTLDPQGIASRAEVAAMLERMVRLIAPKL